MKDEWGIGVMGCWCDGGTSGAIGRENDCSATPPQLYPQLPIYPQILNGINSNLLPDSSL
ncbi:MAG: hypothetical protein OHK0037_21080 [Elainellaceae cyanobacterium]